MILIGTLPLVAFCQSGEKEDYPFSLKVRFYPYGSGFFDDLFLQENPKEAPVPVAMLRGRPGELYTYEGTGTLALYRKRSEPLTGEELESKDPLIQYRKIAQTDLDLSRGEILVFVTPNGKRASEPDTETMEFNLSAMPALETAVQPDHLVFYNGTGARLAGLVGDEKVLLEAGVSSQVPLKPFYDQNKVLVGLVVQYQDSIRVVLEHRARFLPGRRNLFVLMPPERKNSFEILAFRVDTFDLAETEGFE